MLITKEQQQSLIDNFINKGCNAEQLDGFEQGINEMLGLVVRLSKKDHWKDLLDNLKNAEIIIDTRYVEQTITIDPIKNDFLEITLTGVLRERGERKWLDVSIEFGYLTIDGQELEWTDEQELAVYEILKEKFEWQFDFVELNY